MQIITNVVATNAQTRIPHSLQRYFQAVWPLDQCNAVDGRIVGQMLLDLVESKPKDLALAIREFAYRTEMLRECGFRHIGVMLAHLLIPDAQGRLNNNAAIAVLSPSVVTEQQATAIGDAIASSIYHSQVPATALQTVVRSHAVLQSMSSKYDWFVPMLEVLTAHKAARPRRVSVAKRLSSIVAVSDVPIIDVTLGADGANEESSFSSVVPIGAHVVE